MGSLKKKVIKEKYLWKEEKKMLLLLENGNEFRIILSQRKQLTRVLTLQKSAVYLFSKCKTGRCGNEVRASTAGAERYCTTQRQHCPGLITDQRWGQFLLSNLSCYCFCFLINYSDGFT